jgi:hypothetical protein
MAVQSLFAPRSAGPASRTGGSGSGSGTRSVRSRRGGGAAGQAAPPSSTTKSAAGATAAWKAASWFDNQTDADLAAYTREKFDAVEAAQAFFQHNPASGVDEHCRDLMELREAANKSLQKTVSSNYAPFLEATGHVNDIEHELAAVGAALRGLNGAISGLVATPALPPASAAVARQRSSNKAKAGIGEASSGLRRVAKQQTLAKKKSRRWMAGGGDNGTTALSSSAAGGAGAATAAAEGLEEAGGALPPGEYDDDVPVIHEHQLFGVEAGDAVGADLAAAWGAEGSLADARTVADPALHLRALIQDALADDQALYSSPGTGGVLAPPAPTTMMMPPASSSSTSTPTRSLLPPPSSSSSSSSSSSGQGPGEGGVSRGGGGSTTRPIIRRKG